MENLEYKEDTGILHWEEEDVLRWSTHIPLCNWTKKGNKWVEIYCKKMEQVWQKHWNKNLLEKATLDLQEKRKKSQLYTPWTVSLTSQVEILSEELATISFTAKEKQGKGITYLSFSPTLWDLNQGIPLNPLQQSSIKSRKKQELLEFIYNAAEKEDIRLLAHYPLKIKENFSKKRIFLSKEGTNIYFPQGTIALPEEGIPKFTIYSEKV